MRALGWCSVGIVWDRMGVDGSGWHLRGHGRPFAFKPREHGQIEPRCELFPPGRPIADLPRGLAQPAAVRRFREP